MLDKCVAPGVEPLLSVESYWWPSDWFYQCYSEDARQLPYVSMVFVSIIGRRMLWNLFGSSNDAKRAFSAPAEIRTVAGSAVLVYLFRKRAAAQNT